MVFRGIRVRECLPWRFLLSHRSGTVRLPFRIYGWPLPSFNRLVTRGTYVSDPVCQGPLVVHIIPRNPALTPVFRLDHVSRVDERGGDNSITDGSPKQDDQSRWFKSHNSSTPIMESRIHRSLGRPPNRPVHHPPLPHVLRQQLLLHLAV